MFRNEMLFELQLVTIFYEKNGLQKATGVWALSGASPEKNVRHYPNLIPGRAY